MYRSSIRNCIYGLRRGGVGGDEESEEKMGRGDKKQRNSFLDGWGKGWTVETVEETVKYGNYLAGRFISCLEV